MGVTVFLGAFNKYGKTKTASTSAANNVQWLSFLNISKYEKKKIDLVFKIILDNIIVHYDTGLEGDYLPRETYFARAKRVTTSSIQVLLVGDTNKKK